MSVADEGGKKLENEVENKNVEFESRKKIPVSVNGF